MPKDTATIKRAPHGKEAPFFNMSRNTAQNKQLTYAALGLLTDLLSRPGDWEVIVSNLYRDKTQRDKLYDLIKELCIQGYMTPRQKYRNERGQWVWTPYYIYEEALPETERIPYESMAGRHKDDEQDLLDNEDGEPVITDKDIAFLKEVYERLHNNNSEKQASDLPDMTRPYTPLPDTADTEILHTTELHTTDIHKLHSGSENTSALKTHNTGQTKIMPSTVSSASKPKKQSDVLPVASRKRAAKDEENLTTFQEFEEWLKGVLKQFGLAHLYRSKADLKSPMLGQYMKAASDLKLVVYHYETVYQEQRGESIKIKPDILDKYWGGIKRNGWLFTDRGMPEDSSGPNIMAKYLLEYLESKSSPLVKQQAKTDAAAKIKNNGLVFIDPTKL
jgi:hypothetical protein